MCAAHDPDSGPPGSWLMGPEPPAAFCRPQHRLATLHGSCHVPLWRAIRRHHQAVPLPLALAAKKGGWNIEAWHLAGSALGCWGHKSSPSSQGDGWCDWPNMPRSPDRLVQWTEGIRQTCGNPQAEAGTAASREAGVELGREPPWVWILAWPSLWVTLDNSITSLSLHFPVCTLAVELLTSWEGKGKLRNSVGQVPGRAPAHWWVHDTVTAISVANKHSCMPPYWLFVQFCKEFFSFQEFELSFLSLMVVAGRELWNALSCFGILWLLIPRVRPRKVIERTYLAKNLGVSQMSGWRCQLTIEFRWTFYLCPIKGWCFFFFFFLLICYSLLLIPCSDEYQVARSFLPVINSNAFCEGKWL